jgi:hypothetical protein
MKIYAYTVRITHVYTGGNLVTRILFSSQMNVNPAVPYGLFTVKIGTTDYSYNSGSWIDAWTLELVSNGRAASASPVLVSYVGPTIGLITKVGKQWQDFTYIQSTEANAAIIPAGLISLWSGSVATIPSGWALCDGTNGTPNLKDRFILCSGTLSSPGVTGGVILHGHSVTGGLGGGLSAGNVLANVAPAGTFGVSFTGALSGSTSNVNALPPWYSLAYIMKL